MTSENRNILTINGGSSSLKFALYKAGQTLTRVFKGKIDRIGLTHSTLTVKGLNPADNFSKVVSVADLSAAATLLLNWLEGQGKSETIAAVGHRFVNGGPKYTESQKITTEMTAELKKIGVLDPEHLPGEIILSDVIRRHLPLLPQVACFDTSFHHEMPLVAQLLAIPRKYQKGGVKRYGFHGLSYSFLMSELVRLSGENSARGRVVLAHLGNGASLAAVLDGKSIDTSMGFTPTSGVPMGTRSGDLDPGLFLYLARTEKLDAKEMNHMINFQSGLVGVSETSSDMEDLISTQSGDPRAAEAIALFCYQVKKYIGSYAAVLGGLDTLVFAGGIGENAPAVRDAICEGLEFLGVKIDKERNAANDAVISTEAGRVVVRVMHTDEELMIARSVYRVLGIANEDIKLSKANENFESFKTKGKPLC